MLAFLGCVLCTVYILFRYFQASSKLNLPGPSFLTFLLNFHTFGTADFHKVLTKWAKEYGDIYQFSFFGKRCIVANTPDTCKALYNDESRTDYPPGTAFELASGGNYGLTGTKGKTWQDQRKLVAQSIKQFGFRGSQSPVFDQKLDDIISTLTDHCEQPLDIEDMMYIPLNNLTWQMTFSHELSPDKRPLIKTMQEQFGYHLSSKAMLMLRPLFSFLNWDLAVVKEYKTTINKIWNLHHHIIDGHWKLEDKNSEPKDLLDLWLSQRKADGLASPNFEDDQNWIGIRGLLTDVNIAGGGTIYSITKYVILQFLLNPDLQVKAQLQIDSVLGSETKPSLEDRSRLPYVEACIIEMLRVFSAGPFVVRLARKDTELNGLTIPKGTLLLANYWGANHHKNHWDDPLSMKPERFLDDSGNAIVNAEHVLAFGAGRRKCPGEQFGKDAIFLLITRILQKFKILPHPDHPIENTEPYVGFFLEIPNYKVMFVPRLVK